jgi:DNA-binding GntR family transcriptional regulator
MSIAAYIKSDLAARLISGRELPVQQLTLDSLAEHYQVSFTPVRTAVAKLVDEGLLEKGPNRRLTASPLVQSARRTRRNAKLPDPPRDAYRIIADDLLRLSLEGESIFLREEATAEKYNISRSAIRNILHRLAGEGMLDHIPRRGWRLRAFRQDDLWAFNEAREAMELKALELARPKLVPADLERMLQANAPPQSADDPPRIDESLHAYFVTVAGNAYIRDFVERQGRYYRLLFEWEDHDRRTALMTASQHREILTALLEKKWRAARRALSHHILNNHPILDQIAGGRPRAENGERHKREVRARRD